MTDFAKSAFPWIMMGLALAIFFAYQNRPVEGEKKENMGLLGMLLGMVIGLAISRNPIYMPTGMVLGFLIGSRIEKK